MVEGPLAGNWAARAGTPTSILASVGTASGGATAATGSAVAFDAPFTADLTGSVHEGVAPDTGIAHVDMHLSMSGAPKGALAVKLLGQPLGGGGVAMTQGTVSLGPPDQPSLYTGRILSLHGSRMQATASSAAGASLQLTIDVSIDQASGAVTGTVQAESASGG
jgi:hypothetical protein